ncbi:P74 [Penaeus vannamei nudivirus]|nr:P74 [Penaeus vannamei nucleopolyhedrovirus]
MSYTNKDLDNAIAYSNNRYTLRVLNKLNSTHPHLVSHIKYSIEQANADDDYYYTEAFKNKAIKVTVTIPEKLCTKLSCNSINGEKTCTRSDEVSYYAIGDQADFELRCQPACFNLTTHPAIDEETGEEQVQMLRLSYNDDYGCIFIPPGSVWQEVPFYRSESKYEHRLNDLPVGFNMVKGDKTNYSQISYKYNKAYCDAFYDKWNPSTGKCDLKWWEKVLYAVVGEQIVKIVKAGIVVASTGNKSDYPDMNLPTVPEVDPIFKLYGWKQDINSDFILPSSDFEFDGTNNNKIFRESIMKNSRLKVLDYEHNVNIIKILKNRKNQISSNLRRRLEQQQNNYKIILNDQDLSQLHSIKLSAKNKPTIKFRSITKEGEEDDLSVIEYVGMILNGLLQSAMTPAFWEDVGIGILSDAILDQIKTVFRKLANDIIPKLTVRLLEVSGTVLAKVFANSIIATITQTFSKIIIKTVSKIMVQLTKLVAELASVVGVILAIITFFDILLSIWDPLGFNNKFDEEILTSVTQSSDLAMRQSLEVAIPRMNFSIMSNMMLSAEEIIDESLHCYKHIYEYLDSLTVNSEGSRLDKGDEINVSNVDEGELNDSLIVNSKYITPREIYDFEKEHADRMGFFKTSNKAIVATAAMGILLMFAGLPLIALIAFIIMIALINVSYLNSSTLNFGKIMKDFDSVRLRYFI